MKVLHTKTLKDNRRHVLIELAQFEPMPVRPLDQNKFYRLEYPLDDQVFAGHIIATPTPVVWDTLEQRWIA